MNINGYFVKIKFNLFNPDNLDIKDKVLSRALKDWVSPKIIPDEYFKKFRSIISKLNVQLSFYTLETSIGRFATEKSYKQWMIENQKLIQQFNDLRNKLILSYDTFESFIKESNRDLINHVWNKTNKDGGDAHENFIIETNKKIIDLLPNKENLFNSFNYKILVLPIVSCGGSYETIDSYKFIAQEIKNDLTNIISNAFDKIINFYNKEKQIRPNMLESFQKEIIRISFLYFCKDIKDEAEKISKMIYNNEIASDPNGFINYLKEIKSDWVEEIKTVQ